MPTNFLSPRVSARFMTTRQGLVGLVERPVASPERPVDVRMSNSQLAIEMDRRQLNRPGGRTNSVDPGSREAVSPSADPSFAQNALDLL